MNTQLPNAGTQLRVMLLKGEVQRVGQLRGCGSIGAGGLAAGA
jgi:hypothetical protein